MDGILDEYGLVREGALITLFLPATNRAIVFRVKSRNNSEYERFDYGPLPFTAGETLYGYDAASVSVPADGVMPARSYTGTGIYFPAPADLDVYDSTDLWFLPEDYRDVLFHVHLRLRPLFLRTEIEAPVKVKQSRFQKDRVVVGVDKELGYGRGTLEVFHIPRIHLGYKFGNDTNLDLYTFAQFIYGEYVVEIPSEPETIFNAIIKKVPSYWYTYPYHTKDAGFESSLNAVYGFTGFPVYPREKREEALDEYRSLLEQVKIRG